MPRYKYYRAGLRHCDYNQTIMLTVDLEKQIVPGSLEYVIHKLVEEQIGISKFDEKLKNEETGRPAYDPKVMFKIILWESTTMWLAYSPGGQEPLLDRNKSCITIIPRIV